MNPRLFAWIVALAVLAACGSGSTMRVGEGEDTRSDGPVSLAPAPEAQPQPAPATAADPAPQTATAPEGGPTPSQAYAPYGNSRSLDIRRIGQWTRTGISEARRLVIRDVNAWEQFWSELGVGDRPAIDFTRDVVVAVAAGQRPTGGHEIAIDRVTHASGELTVEVVERTPGPNCMTTASLTQPVDVVVVPAPDARSWSFVERKEIRGCR